MNHKTSVDERRRLVAQSLQVGNPGNNARDLPGAATGQNNRDQFEHQIELTLDDVRPYENNPRRSANPKFDDIKESIRTSGLRTPLADKKLLLVAICVLSQWTVEQILANYRLTEAQIVQCLAQLDRIGVIELRPLNRYRLRLSKAFRWRPHGPVMEYFRDHAMVDYFSGGFGGPGEGLSLVHGSISKGVASTFLDRLQGVARDFAQQHLADQKLPRKDLQGYTLLLAMRSWEFEAFSAFRR